MTFIARDGRPSPLPVRYEHAAILVHHLSGWMCRTCGRYFGDQESMARWCCGHFDMPCSTKGCPGRAGSSPYTTCKPCHERLRDEKWAALPKIDWDGESPLCEWDGDRFYWTGDEVEEAVVEHIASGLPIERFRLVVAERAKPSMFEMADFLSDDLPSEFDDHRDFDDIDRVVNDWIAKYKGTGFFPTGPAINPEFFV